MKRDQAWLFEGVKLKKEVRFYFWELMLTSKITIFIHQKSFWSDWQHAFFICKWWSKTKIWILRYVYALAKYRKCEEASSGVLTDTGKYMAKHWAFAKSWKDKKVLQTVTETIQSNEGPRQTQLRTLTGSFNRMKGISPRGRQLAFAVQAGSTLFLTSFPASTKTWSYSLSATRNIIEVTFSKQWIHFLRSDRWPPTSTILRRRETRFKIIDSENTPQSARCKCAVLKQSKPTQRWTDRGLVNGWQSSDCCWGCQTSTTSHVVDQGRFLLFLAAALRLSMQGVRFAPWSKSNISRQQVFGQWTVLVGQRAFAVTSALYKEATTHDKSERGPRATIQCNRSIPLRANKVITKQKHLQEKSSKTPCRNKCIAVCTYIWEQLKVVGILQFQLFLFHSKTTNSSHT